MCRFFQRPFLLNTAQPSGSFPMKKGLPRRVTLQRACGVAVSRQASR